MYDMSPSKGSGVGDDPSQEDEGTGTTQAGHKRFRTPVACTTCRQRKLKCDAVRPACASCMTKGIACVYEDSSGSRKGKRRRASTGEGSQDVQRREQGQRDGELEAGAARRVAFDRERISSLREDTGLTSEDSLQGGSDHGVTRSHPTLPETQDLLPYLDVFLESVHPISCNNFLHPGVLCGSLDSAPPLLLLAICGTSAKFMKDADKAERGRRWIAEAKDLIMSGLGHISTLVVTAIQLVIAHDLHEGDLTSAWTLTGIASRMALQLGLHRESLSSEPTGTSMKSKSGSFLQQECSRRLMWAVFVSDLLFTSGRSRISEEDMADVPLPCNLWNFTQGVPCTTLRLHQLERGATDVATRQATNPCAYLIKILVIRRRILEFLARQHSWDDGHAWTPDSRFNALSADLHIWHRNLPTNFSFEKRNMFTFRTSRHLDIFLMIHAWYHQASYMLYGAWVPGTLDALSAADIAKAPVEFLDLCMSRCTMHARSITSLAQKILAVEADHLFRDAWFSLCVYDSTQIQIVAFQDEERRTPATTDREGIAKLLKVNMKALINTMSTIGLARIVYDQCYAMVSDAGLGDPVDLPLLIRPLSTNSHSSLNSADSALEILKRYPFLSPAPQPDAAAWTSLFHTTNFSTSVAATRSPTPTSTPEMEPVRDTLDANMLAEMLNMDEFPTQLLYPWGQEEVQALYWPPLQDNQMIQAAGARLGDGYTGGFALTHDSYDPIATGFAHEANMR